MQRGRRQQQRPIIQPRHRMRGQGAGRQFQRAHHHQQHRRHPARRQQQHAEQCQRGGNLGQPGNGEIRPQRVGQPDAGGAGQHRRLHRDHDAFAHHQPQRRPARNPRGIGNDHRPAIAHHPGMRPGQKHQEQHAAQGNRLPHNGQPMQHNAEIAEQIHQQLHLLGHHGKADDATGDVPIHRQHLPVQLIMPGGQHRIRQHGIRACPRLRRQLLLGTVRPHQHQP